MHNILKIVNSPVKFKVREFYPNIYHLEFENQQDLTSTLLRFQEHYESPKFRNKVFTIEQFVRWYRSEKKRFTYFSDWTGFNFPAYVLKPFYEGKFPELTEREKVVLKRFSDKKDFYVIGTYKSKCARNDKSTKKHEIAHALFYLNQRYKTEVTKLLSGLNLKPAFKYLKSIGYHKDVLLDESHAYLLTDSEDLMVHGIKFPADIPKKLDSLYNKHLKTRVKRIRSK